MNVKEVKPEFIFQGYSEGKHYVCVDFIKQKYVDCDTITVGELQELVNKSDSVKFFRVEASAE